MSAELTDLEKLAVAKAVNEKTFKALSADLAPGTYAVRVGLVVDAELVKGEPVMRTRTVDVKWRTVVAALLAEMAKTHAVDTAVAAAQLQEIIQRCSELGEDEAAELEARVGVPEVLARINEELAKLPKTKVTGSIRAVRMETHAVRTVTETTEGNKTAVGG